MSLISNKVSIRIVLVFMVLALGLSSSYAQKGKEKKAQVLYDKLSYIPAIEKYERYLKKNPDNYEALWRLSNSYRLTNQYAEAEYWYGQTVQHPECDAEHKLHYAQILQTNGKYSEAATWYNNYKELVPSDGRASYQAEASGNPSNFYLEEERYKIKNEGFNSKSYDFGAVYYKEGLVYSSSWDLEQAIERIHTWTGTPFFDLYYIEKKEEKEDKDNKDLDSVEDVIEEGKEKIESSTTEWKRPKELKGEANTKYHEGPVTFSQDGSRVWFTRNNYDGKVAKSSDGIVKLKLYRADLDGDKWKNVEEFQYNNDEYSVGHAALSLDGSKLYFVSDMPGGYGGTDLYVSEGSGDSWGTPMNLGPAINTEGDEMFPYVHLDGKLYFASDGLGGMGGLDIFEAKGEGTNWGRVKNVGHPVNSSYDDFSLVYNPKHTGGYLTSDRPGGQGSDDIYSFTDDGIYLEGIVVDKETDEPICASTVILMEGDKEKGTVVTECDGYFEFVVLPNKEYSLPATAEGYEPGGEEVSTADVKPGEKIEVKIPLQPIKPIILVVKVVDAKTGEVLSGSKVGVLGACEDSLMQGESDANGMSMYELERDGCEYAINANMKDYLPGDGNIKTPKGYDTDTLNITISLEQLIPEILIGQLRDKDGNIIEGVILHHIYYNFDKSFIRKDATADLDVVLNFMTENEGTYVQIASHTDARASFEYNESLSSRRANAAMNWLVKKGISKERLTANGFGESQPLNGCTDNVKCSEEEHQRNRRTEFRVTGGGGESRSAERSDFIVDPCTKCPF